MHLPRGQAEQWKDMAMDILAALSRPFGIQDYIAIGTRLALGRMSKNFLLVSREDGLTVHFV